MPRPRKHSSNGGGQRHPAAAGAGGDDSSCSPSNSSCHSFDATISVTAAVAVSSLPSTTVHSEADATIRSHRTTTNTNHLALRQPIRKRQGISELRTSSSWSSFSSPKGSKYGGPRDFFSDLGFSQRAWARRRHPVVVFFLVAVFIVVWGGWTTTTLIQFAPTGTTAGDSLLATPPGGSSLTVVGATGDAMGGVTPTSLAAPSMLRGSLPVANTQHSHYHHRLPLSNTIPLPLPKEKVTVVLMNYSRPRMIRESSMMRTLLSHPNVDEVLLLHSNPATAFEFVHPKVQNIDAIQHNNEMGLSLRFYFCQMASHPWVLHLDDDMEFTTEALNELLIEYGRNSKRIVGKFGRNLTPGNSFQGYNSKSTHKATEVVLTKLMLMERDLCSAFFEYAHLVWSDVILHNGEGPLWNGEDIFMSLVANHVYGKERTKDEAMGAAGTSASTASAAGPSGGSSSLSSGEFNNYAMDWLDVWQADDSLKDYDNGKYDISGGMSGIRIWNWRWWQTLLRRNRHYSYRGQLWQLARARLQELTNRVSPSIVVAKA